jgi:hypothetical protein
MRYKICHPCPVLSFSTSKPYLTFPSLDKIIQQKGFYPATMHAGL